MVKAKKPAIEVVDNPVVISWSEISAYRQCPFKHHLAYRERWQSDDDKEVLARGTAWHEILEAHYRSQDASIPRLLGLDELTLEQSERQELLQWMWEGYSQHWAKEDKDWQVKAVEFKSFAPLPNPFGGPSRFVLKVKIDLVAVKRGKLWIWDHKSGRNLPSDRELDLDDQFGLYMWCMRQIGYPVIGALYNAARTQRNVSKPQPLNERFSRTMLSRVDEELDMIAKEAYITAMRAWPEVPSTYTPERNPDTDTCRWKCFPEGTLIDWASVIGASRRKHNGPMIKIVTRNGRVLTGTPEHPVLTPSGWVPLGFLQEGQHVVCDGPLQTTRGPVIGHNVYDGPAEIAEVFHSASQVGALQHVASSGCDFYGQRPTSQVEVVWADRQLRNEVLAKPLTQLVLAVPHQRQVILPLLGRESQGFIDGSGWDPSTMKDTLDRSTLNSVFSGQRGHGLPSQVLGSDVIASLSTLASCGTSHSKSSTVLGSLAPFNTGYFGLGTQGDPHPIQSLAQGPVGMARLPTDLSQGNSRLVELDDVIEIHWESFNGWVFDLSTAEGWFSAQGIIAHNCDFTEACLSSRKGGRLEDMLRAHGYQPRPFREVEIEYKEWKANGTS